MPNKPAHPCSKHAWILVPAGSACPECIRTALPAQRRDERPAASQRGYGPEHRRKRDELIRERRWCDDPYKRHPDRHVPGRVRDHIIPLNKGGTDDKNNEQLLCQSCHNYKMYRDGSRGVKKVSSGG